MAYLVDHNGNFLVDSDGYYLVDSSEPHEPLYEPDKIELVEQAYSIIVPNVEEELIAYFARNPKEMRAMPARRFEELVASIFRNQGYKVELTQESRDGGFDVLAVRQDDFLGSSNYLIECKRYAEKNKVGVGIVRSLYGVVESNVATKGVVVTTSFFTSDAKKFSEQNSARLSLSDFDKLVAWLNHIKTTS